jgi:xanthosine phosphorylase
MSGTNFLTGPNDESIGPRFPSMRDAYDPELRERLRAAGAELGTELAEGVYAAVGGPTFETPRRSARSGSSEATRSACPRPRDGGGPPLRPARGRGVGDLELR